MKFQLQSGLEISIVKRQVMSLCDDWVNYKMVNGYWIRGKHGRGTAKWHNLEECLRNYCYEGITDEEISNIVTKMKY